MTPVKSDYLPLLAVLDDIKSFLKMLDPVIPPWLHVVYGKLELLHMVYIDKVN